jgi:hypothetical protein
VRAGGFEPPRVAPPGPKLRTQCAGWCSPGLQHAFKLGRRRRAVPSCIRLSWGVAARPVSNLVSIGLRSRLVADDFGAPALRDSGPDRPAGQGRADWRRSTNGRNHFGWYPVGMSQGPAPIQGVPHQHRFDYGGRCWWCGAVADSREHKHKKTDMTREFGVGPYVRDSGVVRGST